MMLMMEVGCGIGSCGLMLNLAGHRRPLYIRSELACLGLSPRHEAWGRIQRHLIVDEMGSKRLSAPSLRSHEHLEFRR